MKKKKTTTSFYILFTQILRHNFNMVQYMWISVDVYDIKQAVQCAVIIFAPSSDALEIILCEHMCLFVFVPS